METYTSEDLLRDYDRLSKQLGFHSIETSRAAGILSVIQFDNTDLSEYGRALFIDDDISVLEQYCPYLLAAFRGQLKVVLDSDIHSVDDHVRAAVELDANVAIVDNELVGKDGAMVIYNIYEQRADCKNVLFARIPINGVTSGPSDDVSQQNGYAANKTVNTQQGLKNLQEALIAL